MSSSHAQAAEAFIRQEARTDWHDESLWMIRQKRDQSAHAIPEWETLRNLASQIKEHTLSHLAEYLEQFEANALAHGIRVHWAENAQRHNEIVTDILQQRNAQKIVKSKSMLTEECHLNEHLEKHGIQVVDTDLGERIIQLKGESPSHIVLPAIHLKKEEVGEVFHQKLGTEKGASDPTYLTESARQHLRAEFLEADAAITGVNFGVAETGGVVICTNEGNADLGVHAAPIQIHCMGIEKLIPLQEHLGIFTRLLARSATGQPVTIYTSHYQKPRSGTEMHIVLVDNGRSTHLAKPSFRHALKCIRCGACMNTCPIYRRSGGHSYRHTIPGPIGSILTPGIDLKQFSDLPFASTLCGSCSDVCPVKINIHEQLYQWRQEIAQAGHLPPSKTFPMKIAGRLFQSPVIFDVLGKLGRKALNMLPRWVTYGPWNAWGKGRELPISPKTTFSDWYKQQSHEKS
ncbi:lactate utilization protein B [Pontibacter sp. G13]|uniref:lactate utilization protein B n=1 Tax=Pontibacter sp. G13 TaxID=3074898 RepID=UPI00288AF1BE|nr:lactate utilization protein B [Pontibacter sp. G13]WNJ19022.1 lactate utilization protein B [Pontibacter sp. G13]